MEDLHSLIDSTLAEKACRTPSDRTKVKAKAKKKIEEDKKKKKKPECKAATPEPKTAPSPSSKVDLPEPTTTQYAETKPSGEIMGRPIKLDEVLSKFKTFKIRQDWAFLVGGIVNNGVTENDIDILIKNPVDPEIRHIMQFRIVRMLGPELGSRVRWLDDEFGGPFTSNVPLGDIVVEIPEDLHVKRMDLFSATKQDDPLLDIPSMNAPYKAILQAHFRGKSLHMDFRIKISDKYLVGWTIVNQTEGSIKEDIETIEAAKKIADTFDINGNKYFKPMVLPKSVVAEPKTRQPVVWSSITDTIIDEGEIGATRFFKGVIVKVDEVEIDYGIQQPYYHEYFVSNSKFIGQLRFRLLTSSGEREDNSVPKGEAFWICSFAKEIMPTVLTSRAVKRGNMPFEGLSGLPSSIEGDIPKEFRYWEKGLSQNERLKKREALVDSKLIGKDSIKIVDGKFRLVHKKYFLGIDITKSAPKNLLEFKIIKQIWKGQQVIRTTPSRTIYWFIINDPKQSGLRAWQFLSNPFLESEKITAVKPQPLFEKDKALLKLEGDIAPKSRFNETKETPSWASIEDSGNIELIEDTPGFVIFELKGSKIRGKYSLIQEENESSFWIFESWRGIKEDEDVETEKSKITVRDGMQIWDVKDKKDGVDRKQLKPIALFTPMKPTKAYYDLETLVDEWGSKVVLSSGLTVEPKFNGIRLIVQYDGKKVFIYFEDSIDGKNKAFIFPKVSYEAKIFGQTVGPYIFDGELLEFESGGKTAKPRRDLARFAGSKKEQDDTNVRIQVFDALFLGKHGNLTATPHEEVRKYLVEAFEEFAKDETFKHFDLVQPARVKSITVLRKAIDKATKLSGSEGAMLKLDQATYSLGGRTSSWAKYKKVRVIYGMVINKTKKKRSPQQKIEADTWMYDCAIGPVPADRAEKFVNPEFIDNKVYVPIGRTFSTSVNASKGDVLEVEATEILYDTSSKMAKINWFSPVVKSKVENKKPSSLDDVMDMLKPEEIKKSLGALIPQRVSICKSAEERYVLAIVLEPEVIDGQNQLASIKEIRNSCHNFMHHYAEMGLYHREPNRDRVAILENYLAPCDFKTEDDRLVKFGSWLMGLRIICDDIWKKIKTGEINGLSIFGTSRLTDEPGAASKYEFAEAE